MSVKPPASPAATRSLALAGVFALALAGCSASRPASETHVEPEWRLVPESIVLGKRRQFFLYGRHLDGVRLSAPPSVQIEKGEVKTGGKALSLYLTVLPLSGDSLAKGETKGSREIAARTADTALAFTLKVVDEMVPR